MAIKYPLLLIVLPLIIIIFYFLTKPKKKEKKEGSKIANTSFLKNTDYYKKVLKSYNYYKGAMIISFIIAITSAILLCSRIQKVETTNINEYKRDIFLCMDVSASVDELNVQLVENLKDTVKSLKGERFGISIFNTTSVLISPLTDDYDFILAALDEIQSSIKANNNPAFSYFTNDDFFYVRNYIYSGTIEGNETRGSSLIGDGLASCVYSFPRIKEDRTRIIIFSTDNDLAGEPLVTLDKAAEISKKKNIVVYGIGTSNMTKANRTEFKNAMKKADGKYYEQSSKTVNNIVKDIEKSSKTLTDNKFETKSTDLPTIPFILLLLSTACVIIYSKKVMS